MEKPKIVIIGGGFGGLTAAKTLENHEAEITMVDKTNYHLFQPLLYQVATAALSPADIALPIRAVFSKNKNIRVIMSEAIKIDRVNHKVILKDGEIYFDYLILSPGSRHSYFGNNSWEKNAPGLKTLSDALNIRERILNSLELAEKENDPAKREKYLTFVIVGGGPTGVEMAGAIAEIAKETLMNDFRNISSGETKIFLVEAAANILSAYPDELSNKAKDDLEKMGVMLKLNTMVTDVTDEGIITEKEKIKSSNIIWAAGNTVSPLIKSLDVKLDKSGRAKVNEDLSIEGDPNIFVIGDAALVFDKNGKQIPGVAQGAIQEGAFVGKVIKERKEKSERGKFEYTDKGNMATIGRAKAIAEIKGFKLSGFFAWLTWCFIHIFFLIGYRNRFRVMLEWAWYYITFRHGIRLIVGKESNLKKSENKESEV